MMNKTKKKNVYVKYAVINEMAGITSKTQLLQEEAAEYI